MNCFQLIISTSTVESICFNEVEPINNCGRVCIRACVRECVHVSVCAIVRVYMCVRVLAMDLLRTVESS